MKTYEQQTLPFGATASTCSPAVSRASRSASRANARVRPTTATSGPQCSELFGLFDRAGSWARTFSESLIGRREWFSSRCVLIWRRQLTKAELMPHQIRITGIKCERLQDISEEDCMKEGILGDVEYDKYEVYGLFGNSDDGFDTPREAFASLIDKVSGRGTWKRNPWVVAYEFELVK